MTTRVLQGDCRNVLPTLPANSVHTVVTSPPYYGLRDYGVAGQLGLEATPGEYIQTMVAVFREVRRVLRPDGTCWVNLGSSYASGDKRPSQSLDGPRALACDSGGIEPLGSLVPDCAYSDPGDECLDGSQSHRDRSADIVQLTPQMPQPDVTTGHDSEPPASVGVQPSLLDVLASTTPSLPQSDQDACDLVDEASACPSVSQTSSAGVRAFSRNSCSCGSCGICFAYSAIPMLRFKAKDLMMMPELFALALQADGWWIRSDIIWSKPNPMPESVTDRPTSAHEHVFLLSKRSTYYYDADAVREEPTGRVEPMRFGREVPPGAASHSAYHTDGMIGRNLRNVWTIATQAFPEVHYATFPTALAERCIKAGTSERGCCAACGTPWVRQTIKAFMSDGKSAARGTQRDTNDNRAAFGDDHGTWNVTTTGWAPGCQCNAPTQPCTVLDPFAGAGTTGLVADRLQRDAVLIELSPAYCAMLRNRITNDAPLFAEVTDAPLSSQ